jgi:hypothetical protein
VSPGNKKFDLRFRTRLGPACGRKKLLDADSTDYRSKIAGSTDVESYQVGLVCGEERRLSRMKLRSCSFWGNPGCESRILTKADSIEVRGISSRLSNFRRQPHANKHESE